VQFERAYEQEVERARRREEEFARMRNEPAVGLQQAYQQATERVRQGEEDCAGTRNEPAVQGFGPRPYAAAQAAAVEQRGGGRLEVRQAVVEGEAGHAATPPDVPPGGSASEAHGPEMLPFAPGEADLPPVDGPAVDPFLAARADLPADMFDEMKEQYTGIILGIAICSVRQANEEGKAEDYFLCVPGDDVKVTFPTCGTPPQAVSDTFTIVDLYESKMSEYDSSFAFVPIEKLQQLRGMIDPTSGDAAATSIQIKLRKGANLEEARNRLVAAFPPERAPFRVRTWKQMQGPLLAAVQLETTILNILLFLIIAVAGFGILATFYMIVVEKTKDVGILKSLGAPSSGVMNIFLGYGLSLGIVGSGVGMVLGLLFVININRVARVIEWITGREVFDPTVYYFQEIPTIIEPFTVAWIVAGAMIIAVLASVLPAVRAARLHPVEALRYE
jgi:lipoprotein-releasing system permease protein